VSTVAVTWRGGEAKRRVRKGTRRGLRVSGEFLLSLSNAVVPIEEGTLQRSGAVTVTSDGEAVAVSYDTPYAARQHEELTWKHKPGRTAKYLEGPFEANKGRLLEIIAEHARRELTEGA
jgi:hypothetical protein